ncbi:MAG: GtrA family protein [Anaeromyxobacteraceae bacterium]
MSGRLLLEAGRFVRSNLSSLVATGLEWLLVTGLVVARAHYLAAAAAGAVLGAGVDFGLKRHWAFRRARKGRVHQEAARYLVVSAGSLALNLGLSWLLVDGLGLPKVPGIIAASVSVGAAFNYPLHRHFTFPHGVHRPAEEGGGAR